MTRNLPRAAFFLPLAALLSLSPRTAAQTPAAVTRIACVGEHSTDSGRVENSLEYPAALQALLGDAYQVAEFGFGTASLTKTQFPTTRYADSPEYAASLTFAPHIVILGPWGRGDSVGTVHIDDAANNNVHLYQDPTPLVPADFQTALDSLITSYEQLPEPPSILVALPLPFPYGTGAGHIADIILPTTQSLATTHQLTTIDLFTPFIDQRPEFEDADHLTPTPSGMQHMAQLVFAAIQAHETGTPVGGSAGSAGTGGTSGADSLGGAGGVAGLTNAGGVVEVPATGGSADSAPITTAGAPQAPSPGGQAPSSAAETSVSSSSSGCSVSRTPPQPGLPLALLVLASWRSLRRRSVG